MTGSVLWKADYSDRRVKLSFGDQIKTKVKIVNIKRKKIIQDMNLEIFLMQCNQHITGRKPEGTMAANILRRNRKKM